MNKEMLKSATLISLFVLCIVLTAQLMFSLSTANHENVVQALVVDESIDITQIISPQSYRFSFGGGVYTQNYTEENGKLWALIRAELVESLENQEDLNSLTEIEGKRWTELFKGRAVNFKMPYTIALSQLQSLFELESAPILEDISFNEILISSDSKESIFFKNEAQNTYYRMDVTGWSEDVTDIVATVEKSNVIEYRRVEDLFGLSDLDEAQSDKENNALFPVTSHEYEFVNVTPEIDVFSSDESTLKSYANKAFGEQFNFVKKMRDVDGSVIYLYGYANKALRLGADGSIEYSQRVKRNGKPVEISLSRAMKMAMTFLDQYGGYPNSLYLAEFSRELDDYGNSVIILGFDYKVKQFRVLTEVVEDQHAVQIEIQGDTVTKFNKRIYKYKNGFMLDGWSSALTINEILEVNGTRIESDYEASLPEGTRLTTSEIWTEILNELSGIELAYYKEEGMPNLHPVWTLDIGNISYAFRIYDGELLSAQER